MSASDPGLSLRFLGDPILREVCRPVEHGDMSEARMVGIALNKIVTAERGMGLSANQIGSRLRIFVAWIGDRPQKRLFVNPLAVEFSEDTRLCVQEGCLSIPGFRTSTRRPVWVKLAWNVGLVPEPPTEVFRMEDAQVICHELDHLNGILLVDRVSRQKRRQAEALVQKHSAIVP